MTNSLPRFSVRDDHPLDAKALKVLAAVHRALATAACPYFLMGAMARDLFLVHAFGRPVYRATQDLDFGVAVESWGRFEAVKQTLARRGFEAHPHSSHRFSYQRPDWEHPIPVDLIPFGGLEAPAGMIAWPPGNDLIMTVAGFDEVFSSAVHVEISGTLTIPVASLAGLAVLKLFAWRDRHATNDKDATDLFLIMSSYADVGNDDRLFGEHLPLLEAAGCDLPFAGERLLGRDAGLICAQATRSTLAALLADDTAMGHLSGQMAGGRGFGDDAYRNVVERYLNEFRIGFAGA